MLKNNGRAGFLVFAELVFMIAVLCAGGCARKEDGGGTEDKPLVQDTSPESYGVFLGVDADSFQISSFSSYDMVVVDAQELKSEQLAQLHSTGHIVYSYLNIGSIEDSREYYDRYRDLCLDRYENWPEEDWVDVTDDRWKTFVTQDLPAMIRKKDPSLDGLFLDNLDIYGHIMDSRKYEEKGEETYDALVEILEAYQEEGIPVVINGADEFVLRLIRDGRTDLLQGVNQETVFTRIKSYKRDKFDTQDEEETGRLKDYLKECSQAGKMVFLLEYTDDEAVAEEIAAFCEKNGYRYYVSEHVDLRGFRE
ncbi:MAG: endo alpha-1,4 polygalactosaminidase [Eubacteriales bacterium]|nr:endo alpha-1,4 polygalactosaminidase [Eubacteriales bacterium]